jgi:hypothetical protein
MSIAVLSLCCFSAPHTGLLKFSDEALLLEESLRNKYRSVPYDTVPYDMVPYVRTVRHSTVPIPYRYSTVLGTVLRYALWYAVLRYR